jgi:hypothetical protein
MMRKNKTSHRCPKTRGGGSGVTPTVVMMEELSPLMFSAGFSSAGISGAIPRFGKWWYLVVQRVIRNKKRGGNSTIQHQDHHHAPTCTVDDQGLALLDH